MTKTYPIIRVRPLIVVVLVTLPTSLAWAYNREEGQKFHDAVRVCEALAREKKYDAARDCLTPLIASATHARTRSELAYRQAEFLEQKDAFAQAREAFMAVASTYPREPMGARARFRAARLLEDHLGGDALGEYKRLVREAPDSVAAVNALVHIEELLDTRELFEFYERELVARPQSQLAATILSRVGQTADPKQAAKIYDALAKRDSSKHNHALYQGARAHLAMGDVPGAQERLQQILDSRERTPVPSQLIPAMNSPLLDDARLLLGEIARDQVRDAKLARVHFQTLIDDYPDSRLVDDALWALAQLGDDKERAARMAELRRLRPRSRFLK